MFFIPLSLERLIFVGLRSRFYLAPDPPRDCVLDPFFCLPLIMPWMGWRSALALLADKD